MHFISKMNVQKIKRKIKSSSMHNWIIAYKSESIYHSPSLDINHANKLIGLSLGISQLTSHWTQTQPSQLKGLKNSTFIYYPEPDFMIILIVNKLENESHDSLRQERWNDLVSRSYDWFRLLYNTFEFNMITQERESFKDLLEIFYSRFPLDLTLNYLHSIYFMPLDGSLFSRIVSILHDILDSIGISESNLMLLWNHYLVYSNLQDQKDSFILYDYLTHPGTGIVDDGIVNQVKDKAEPIISTKPHTIFDTYSDLKKKKKIFKSMFTGYLCPNIREQDQQIKELKMIYFSQDSFHLILFQFQGEWTFAFCIPQTTLNQDQLQKLDFYSRLKVKIESSFSKIPSIQLESCLTLANEIIQETSSECMISWFYWNSKTFAFKSCFTLKKLQWTGEMSLCLQELLQELQENKESLYQQTKHYWILGKRCESRILFLLLNKSEFNLKQVHQEFLGLTRLGFPHLT